MQSVIEPYCTEEVPFLLTDAKRLVMADAGPSVSYSEKENVSTLNSSL